GAVRTQGRCVRLGLRGRPARGPPRPPTLTDEAPPATRGRFLFVTWAGGGNVQPLAALGTQLLARGHRVRVLAPSELGPRFEADGIACRDLRFGDLRAVADDVIAEAGPEATDVIVADYM